jgi:hypothetical protein
MAKAMIDLKERQKMKTVNKAAKGSNIMNRQHSQGVRFRRSGRGRQDSRLRWIAAAVVALAAMAPAATWSAESGALRVHNIFGSNMVIQRDRTQKGTQLFFHPEEEKDWVASGGCPPEAPTDPNVRN